MLSKYLRRVLLAGLLILALLLVGIYLAIGPSLACHFPTQGPAQAGISTRTLTSGGVERCYLLYTPPGYDPARPAPVVFSLHGFAGTPEGLRKMTRWENIADSENFLVVYPHGSSFPLRWNTSSIANIEHIDDVEYIRDMIANLSEIAAVDPERIYVTGFSHGGSMTHRIACELTDRVAAVGIVLGLDPRRLEDCNPSRPIPVIAFYGTADPLAGVSYPTWFLKLVNVSPVTEDPLPPEVIEWGVDAYVAENWAKRNGCDTPPETISTKGDVRGILYTGCNEGAEIVLYTIDDGGHTWPGGSNLPFFGKTSTDIDASRTMWEFFETHPLKNEP